MENWQSIIKDFSESNLSATAFCELKGIKRTTFYYWQKKFRNKELNTSGFIKITTSQPTTSLLYEIEYPNGVKLRPLGQITLSMLHSLIHV